MPYENIPGVRATFLDGAFKIPTASTQPKVLILGTATSGKTYELFNVTAVSQAEAEFGADTELMKGVHEAVAQGADNISVMRIGGTQGSIVVTQATPSATLTITPEYRDNEILARYTLILESSAAGEQRVLVYDTEDEEFVYDSDEEKCINSDVIAVEIDADFDDWSVGDIDDPANAPTLTALISGDFTAENASTSTIASISETAGTDGTSMSLVERYAALNTAYHLLDYQDADIVVPMGVHINDANQADGDTAVYDSHTVPTSGAAGDVLGLVWQYIYRGKLYTYFVESSAVLSVAATKQFGATTVGRITFTAVNAGPAGEAVEVKFVDDGTGGSETVTVSGNTVTIHFEDGVSTVAQVKTAYDAVPAAVALATSASTVAGVLTIPAAQLDTEVPLVLDGALTHEDLTGDEIPAAVATRWQEAVAAEFRECNFAHQLASFCFLASTVWKAMIGVIPTKGPDAYDRIAVADWVGNLPTYTTKGDDECVDTTADNGFGLLGLKLLAGEAGYRDAMVEDGDAGDGLAYGGLILTEGSALPNGEDFPYGISESDEAVDSGGKPVDIGKHIVVTYDRPKLRNAFNGGSTYRGNAAATVAGKIAVTPENKEPIGIEYGRVAKVTDPPRIHSTLINDLARIRMCGFRREEGVGYIIVSCKTAAHPDSDYTRLSTIRSVNKIVQGVRDIAARYIGSEFSGAKLVALQAAIDGYLQSQQVLGFHGGAKAALSYTRSDKILGRLKIKLRMIPPFSIEAIEVETSLAAEESEL